MSAIPMSAWRWEGHAGHLIVSNRCRFHMHTRIGNYRISTIGDYWPEGHTGDQPEEIGLGRTHETYVFRVEGPLEGEPTDGYLEIDSDTYNDCEDARFGHMVMCRKYARIAGAER